MCLGYDYVCEVKAWPTNLAYKVEQNLRTKTMTMAVTVVVTMTMTENS